MSDSAATGPERIEDAGIEPADPAPDRPRAFTVVAVSAAFALPFLWELLGAASNLNFWIGVAAIAAAQLSTFAWSILGAGLVVPVLAYLIALVVARRRTVWSRVRIFVVAFCASEAITLSVLAFFAAGIGAK